MICESQMYDENSFITLTYNEENLPPDGSLSRIELQKFMKRLRKKIEPKKIRFYGCGEYGSNTKRPHYHVCVFGHDFPDKEIIRAQSYKFTGQGKRATKGHISSLYTSKVLEQDIWKKGFVTVGELNFKTAGYVARYVTKKITGPPAKKHYGEKEPEFALMSRMPGIGKPWIEKYKYDIYPKDYFHVNGHKQRPAKYFDTFLEKDDPELYKKIKEKRIEAAEKGENIASTIRGYQLENYRKLVTKTLERKLENER